jgi:hypothetical protein
MTAILYGTFGLSGHRNNIVEQEYFWTQMAQIFKIYNE